MSSSAASRDTLQQQTLQAYLALTGEEQEWSRRLVMLSGSAASAPVALAVVAAGGAVLWTGATEASLRESSLAGLVDFQVTTLSEALRILKNEIRKGLPVSVGVLDGGGEVWQEAVTRGVQPNAIVAGAREEAAAAVLVSRGAVRLDTLCPRVEVSDQVAQTWRERRAGDQALLEWFARLPQPERTRAERWLRSAARLFPRDLFRSYAGVWAASKENR